MALIQEESSWGNAEKFCRNRRRASRISVQIPRDEKDLNFSGSGRTFQENGHQHSPNRHARDEIGTETKPVQTVEHIVISF